MSRLNYGFLDESGILEKKGGLGNYFVIVVIIVGDPGELKYAMKLARRKAKGKFRTHTVFKASKESKGFVKLVLNELSKQNIDIVVNVWDKRERGERLDKNVLYTQLVTQAVKLSLQGYPKLSLTIHKRYTSPQLRERITRQLSELVAEGMFLSVSQLSEVECQQLELADAVAWAVFQKYNRNSSEFYNIFKGKIQKENRLAA